MGNKYTDEELRSELNKNSKEAKELLGNQDKMENFLQELERKLKKVPGVGKKLADIPTMASLIRSYTKKEYKDIPT